MTSSFWARPTPNTSIIETLNKAFVKLEEENDKAFQHNFLKEEDVVITSNNNGLKYKPNLDVLDEFLKDEELSRNLFLEPEEDSTENGFTLEDYFTNPLVLNKLLDYVLDERFCIEEAEQDASENNSISTDNTSGDSSDNNKKNKQKNVTDDDSESDSDSDNDSDDDDDDDDDDDEEYGTKKKSMTHLDEKLLKKQKKQKYYDNDEESSSDDDDEREEEEKEKDSIKDNKNMSKLDDLVDTDEEDDNHKQDSPDLLEFFTKATVAAEILSIDLMEITACFFRHTILITRLWSMLSKYDVLSNDASSSFLKINERLLQYAEIGGLFGNSNSVSNYNSESNSNTDLDIFTRLNNGEDVIDEDEEIQDNKNEQKTIQKDGVEEKEQGNDTETKEQEQEKKESKSNEDEDKAEEDDDDYDDDESDLDIDMTSSNTVLAQFLDIIIEKENMVDKFIKHIELAPLMDFLLKIISTDKPELPTYVTLFLNNHGLIEKLLSVLDSTNTQTAQSTATDFLKALIAISANSNSEIASAIGPNELTRDLVSEKMVTKMGQLMLQGGLPLSNCVGIIIEIIRKNNSDYDFVQVMYTTLESNPPDMKDPIYLGYLVKYFANHLKEFNELLCVSNEADFKTPFGVIEPLGMDRFKICELVAELLHCSNMALLNELGGEEIVEERNVVRTKTIKKFLKKKFKITMVTEVANETEKSGSVESLNSHIHNLNIKSEENSSEDSSDPVNEGPNMEIDTDETQKTVDADNQKLPEDNDDVNESELALRLNPVAGDQMKIALQDCNIVDVILKMLFYFPWNNFLHNVVFDIVQQILNGPLKEGYNKFLIADLFSKSNITHFIVNSDEYCQKYEEENELRLGYMGHLTLIAEEVAKFAAYLEEMDIVMHDHQIEDALRTEEWINYTDGILSETREKYSTVFGDFNVDLYDVLGGEDDEEDDDDQDDQESTGVRISSEQYANGEEEDYDEEDEEHLNVDHDIPAHLRSNPDMIAYNNDGEQHDSDYSDEDDEDDNRQEDMYSDEIEVSLDSHFHSMSNSNSNQTKKSNFLNKKTLFDLLSSEDDKIGSTSSGTKGSNNNNNNNSSSSDDDDEIEGNHYNYSSLNNSMDPFAISLDHKNKNFSSENGGDDDDYIDPNDDGLSYAKPGHPLYSDASNVYARDTKLELLDDDDDYEDAVEKVDNEGADEEDEAGVSLYRQKTSENMQWDQIEQDRIFGYTRIHNNDE